MTPFVENQNVVVSAQPGVELGHGDASSAVSGETKMPSSELECRSLVDAFKRITIWRRGDERAPHKPLLLLLALAELYKGNPRLQEFEYFEPVMRRLLQKYGPPRKSFHAEYPFWRLQADGVWEVQPRTGLVSRSSNTDPRKSELIEKHVKGGFTEEIWRCLKDDSELLEKTAKALLIEHFPEGLHPSIVADLGLCFRNLEPRSS